MCKLQPPQARYLSKTISLLYPVKQTQAGHAALLNELDKIMMKMLVYYFKKQQNHQDIFSFVQQHHSPADPTLSWIKTNQQGKHKENAGKNFTKHGKWKTNPTLIHKPDKLSTIPAILEDLK